MRNLGLFVNGERDDYTTAADARQFVNYVANSHFVVVPEAGHFLDSESKATWSASRKTALSFFGCEVAAHKHVELSPSRV